MQYGLSAGRCCLSTRPSQLCVIILILQGADELLCYLASQGLQLFVLCRDQGAALLDGLMEGDLLLVRSLLQGVLSVEWETTLKHKSPIHIQAVLWVMSAIDFLELTWCKKLFTVKTNGTEKNGSSVHFSFVQCFVTVCKRCLKNKLYLLKNV